jgi:hypothetical protein
MTAHPLAAMAAQEISQIRVMICGQVSRDEWEVIILGEHYYKAG